MKYIIRNDSASPKMDGNSNKTQILTISGMALHPGFEMVSSTLTSDVLKYMSETLVTVTKVDGASSSVVNFSDIKDNVVTTNEPRIIYTADGKEVQTVTVYSIANAPDDEAEENIAPEPVVETTPEPEPEVEDETEEPTEENVSAESEEGEVEEEDSNEDLSKDMSISDAKIFIEAYNSVDELNAFVEGDTRKTIKSAAKARIKELD